MKSAYKKEDKKREAKEVNEEAQDDKAWLAYVLVKIAFRG